MSFWSFQLIFSVIPGLFRLFDAPSRLIRPESLSNHSMMEAIWTDMLDLGAGWTLEEPEDAKSSDDSDGGYGSNQVGLSWFSC